MSDLEQLRTDLLARIGAADLDALEGLRIEALGRKGSITELMKGLGGLAAGERKAAGQALNALKAVVACAIDTRRATLEGAVLESRLAEQRIDLTLPVRPLAQGRIHPISQTIEEMVAIFCQMGFSVAEGPDIEDDFHNFTALNIPPEHPARQDHDTFYFPERADGARPLLRTHTSPVQIRTMQTQPPPLRILVPGRTYRADHDATHSPMFHQIEGLAIDETTHMGHLKGLPDRVLPRHFRARRPAGALPAELFSVHRAVGRGRYRLRALGRRVGHRRRWGLDGDPGLRHGPPQGAGELRHRFHALSGLRLRRRGRAGRDAQIRNPGFCARSTSPTCAWLRHYGFLPLDVPNVATGLGA